MSKNNINLPKTAFAMRANLPQREPEILKLWEKENIFSKIRKSSDKKEKFILHDGPPYANGHIHMGTALNKILKDMIVRFHQMQGKDAVYVPGWDCHGLPIEWKIEEQYKKNKKNKDEVPILDFRQECRQFAKKWIDVHIGEFKRLGVTGDFENYYTTMSNQAEAQIVRELGKFLLNGGLYQGFKPVLWSTVEKTALADAEVEYQDHTSNTIYVAFKIEQTNFKEIENASIIIWTTTPWTIPANRALAFNANIDYVLLEIEQFTQSFNETKIIIAKNLISKVAEEIGIKNFKIVKEFSGKNFENTICSHPFKKLGFDYKVPMFDAKFVNLEQGTGIVHCAPSHGPDDFSLCLQHNIKADYTVNASGLYTDKVPHFEGQHIFKADQLVIDNLKNENKLLFDSKLVHSYPHSWRSKAPLIYRATPQWFISMETNSLRKKAIKSINETNFYPAKGKERLLSMIESRPDWCISRQRVWGVPLPIFINKKTNEPLRDQEVINNIADLFEKKGSDIWFTEKSQTFLGTKYKEEDYTKLNDIVEVWFDSGSTHTFVLENRKDLKWPADMYLEGSDQHRGWFHSSLLQSSGTRDRAPFDSILSHGFVVDGKGMKMSKSAGNVISPEDILKDFGADILRLWVFSSDYSEDLRIDKTILEQNADAYRKIRNTFRYLLGNLNDKYEVVDYQKINPEKLPELEKYILAKIYELDQKFKKSFNEYNLHRIYKDLFNFCTQELSSFYFDIRKDRLYCDVLNSQNRIACIQVLNIILDYLLKWFAPVLVFTTEEIYKLVNSTSQSIHLAQIPKIPSSWQNQKLIDKYIELGTLREAVNLAIEEKRSAKIIGSSLEASVNIETNSQIKKLLDDINLPEYFITSIVDLKINDGTKIPKVDVKKADGEKCNLCWKILEKPCGRSNCGINAKK